MKVFWGGSSSRGIIKTNRWCWFQGCKKKEDQENQESSFVIIFYRALIAHSRLSITIKVAHTQKRDWFDSKLYLTYIKDGWLMVIE